MVPYELKNILLYQSGQSIIWFGMIIFLSGIKKKGKIVFDLEITN